MKLLVKNFTTHTAYIVILDYDEETKYLTKSVVFEIIAIK